MNLLSRFVIVLVLLHSSTQGFAQGSLTPPGPPEPGMRTLDQIQPHIPISSLPYDIAAPGYYYLTTNLYLSVDGDGILVEAHNVTVDLNGFTLESDIGTSTGHGVKSIWPLNLKVKNGTIQHWAGDGIMANGRDTVVENVALLGNRGAGVRTGSGARIQSSTLDGNGAQGIVGLDRCLVLDCIFRDHSHLTPYVPTVDLGDDGRVEGCVMGYAHQGVHAGNRTAVARCTVSGMADAGIVVGTHSTVSDCIAVTNRGSGIMSADDCQILRCTASSNLASGVVVTNGCQIVGTTAIGNGAGGIQGIANLRVSGCVANGNQTGFIGGSGVSVADCTAISNQLAGVLAGAGSSVLDCMSVGNGAFGILVQDGSTVRHCEVRQNGMDGIQVTGGCLVEGNNCDQNGTLGTAAGIHGTATSSRIEGNNMTYNGNTGIRLDSGGNAVVRNSSRGHAGGNYTLAAGNDVGPIGSATNSTSPWANISF